MTIIAAAVLACAGTARAGRPVILDTDLGSDIDDTWALVTLLNSPELDVKMITTEVGDTRSKARTIAKILDRAGRTDIPIGVGVRQATDGSGNRQHEWSKDYELSSYPGTVHEDGVDALIETVMESGRPVTVIAIGPLPTLAEALDRRPEMAEQAHFIGMHGSVRRGYGGSPEPDAEYNVKHNPEAAQTVFTAPWESVTITPLDTCGIVHLEGDRYDRVRTADTSLTEALMENYRTWYPRRLRHRNQGMSDEEVRKKVKHQLRTKSTTLYDTVAVYLAISREKVKMEKLGIRVTDDGYTRIDSDARIVNVAAEWKDLDGYKDWLVERLTAAH